MRRSLQRMGRRTWLQVGRLIVFGLFILTGLIFLGWTGTGHVFAGVAVLLVLTVLADTAIRKLGREREWQVWVLFLIDSVMATALIHMSGGFDGPFAVFLFVHTFVAGVYLGMKGGAVIAVTDSLMLAGLAFLTISGYLDPSPAGSTVGKLIGSIPSGVSFQYALLFVMIYAGFLLITGLVTGYLSEHLLLERGRADGILRQLREARTMSREILESLSDGVLVIDNSGRPMSINNAGRTILSLGDGWKESVTDTEVYTMLREFQLSEGMPSVVEISLGSNVIECRMGTFLDHLGNAAGALASLTDITETVQLKKQLQEREKLAAIGRLSSTMAHEIRNPLASMSGAAHILKLGSLDWDKTDRMTDLISSQARRISEIIEGYLELSRRNRVSYTSSVSLESVAHEAVEVARQGFGGRTEIVLHVEGNYIVLGSQARLVQLLTNIIRNSVESMEDRKDAQVSVSVVRSDSEGMAELVVADNGPGIPRKILENVYNPFFTTKDEGTGLGLYVARRVARDHRGRIDIDTRPDEGTTVRVIIPVAPPDMVFHEQGGTDGE